MSSAGTVRAVAYRQRRPAEYAELLQTLESTRIMLLSNAGPLCFVVSELPPPAEAAADAAADRAATPALAPPKPLRVTIGARQTCTCGKPHPSGLCVHILFVMTKVLRVPASDPLSWQVRTCALLLLLYTALLLY